MRRTRARVDQNTRLRAEATESASTATGSVGEGSNVNVLAVIVGADQLENLLDELLGRILLLEPDHLHGLLEALHMLREPEDVGLFLLRVPVRANPFENRADGGPAHIGN